MLYSNLPETIISPFTGNTLHKRDKKYPNDANFCIVNDYGGDYETYHYGAALYSSEDEEEQMFIPVEDI